VKHILLHISGSWLIRMRLVHSWVAPRTLVWDWKLILQAPPNLHPFVLDGLVRTKTFFTLLLGVSYSMSKSDSSSSSEVRSYDHRIWETNKQMRETNTPCVPFDGFLFYHWERWQKVDHVRHRGLKEWFSNSFSPCPYFVGLFRALQAPCGVAIDL